VLRYMVFTMDVERAQKALKKMLPYGFVELCWRIFLYAARPNMIVSQDDKNLVSQVLATDGSIFDNRLPWKGPFTLSLAECELLQIRAILDEHGGTHAIAICFSERFCDLFCERATEYGAPASRGSRA
jgi:hypothetical protein